MPSYIVSRIERYVYYYRVDAHSPAEAIDALREDFGAGEEVGHEFHSLQDSWEWEAEEESSHD